MHVRLGITEAYDVLGLEQGASLEVVKSAYKQIALRAHPDKNPGNPNATQEFQQVSEAYRVLLKHLDKTEDSEDSDSEYEYDYDSDDEYASYIYMKIFDLFMRGEAHTVYARAHRRRPRVPEESPEEYRARIQRSLDEQRQGEERRKQAAAARKERRAREREEERQAAEERQRLKGAKRLAEAKSQRQKDEQTIRLRQQQIQQARSAVFAAARAGDAKMVEKGVWEENVDAAGGEVKDGCQDFVDIPPNDPLETLLHIAARLGNRDLVQWLDGHGAELEERDSAGFTAFHVALQSGRISVVSYFFEEHARSEDTVNLYDPPPSTTLLSLAMDSGEPELVWMILDKGLASKQEMAAGWDRVTTSGMNVAPKLSPKEREKMDDISQLLVRYGGFAPPRKDTLHRKATTATTATSTTTTSRVQTTDQSPVAHARRESKHVAQTPVSGGRGLGWGRGRRRRQGSIPSAAMR
ncbi:putative ATP-dependent protein binding [Lyophyllum shimeji]|uniref:ATP-dependent protein binding n=1 Tax=Lyophyllum shimeji TaxID=47721 RepID=A0A9P3PFB3_LYOSH|nr:putative ATP-dependent protein binding [Lyophyllum shimeji]